MTRATALVVLIALASSAAGANLTADQQATAVASVREYARSYTESLPNYACIQATKQTVVGSSEGTVGGPRRLLAGVVEIEEEINFVNRREVRKLTKINGSPASDVQPDPITFSRGEFGNLLDIILASNSGTEIHWDREAKLEGRRSMYSRTVFQSQAAILCWNRRAKANYLLKDSSTPIAGQRPWFELK